MQYQVILYYKYARIADPTRLRDEQRIICEKLNLKGRIIIAKEGINGTIEGEVKNIEEYCSNLISREEFKDIVFKKSVGDGNSFPKLKVKVRDEIVSAHLGDDDLDPNEITGEYIEAEKFHEWLSGGRKIKVVDMRNEHEYKIGHFEGSINSGMKYFRDLPKVPEKLKGSEDEVIVAVCTGGVRCEKASGYLKKKGFRNVYQLKDGMATYMEKFPNSFFKGKLYVFDGRIAMDYDSPEKHEIVGKCDVCQNSTENFVNCKNPECNAHFLMCENCKELKEGFCSTECKQTSGNLTSLYA